MRILIFSPWCDDMDLNTCKGTPENAYLIKGLLERGHEVTYICQGSEEEIPESLKKEERLKIIPVESFRLLKPNPLNYLFFPVLLKNYATRVAPLFDKLLKSEKFHILYNIGGFAHKELVKLCRVHHIPYAVKTMGTILFEEVRGKPWRKFQFYREYLVFKEKADHYFLVDDGTRTLEVAKYFGIEERKITVLPNPRPKDLKPKSIFGRPRVIGYFSRFDKLKGTDLLFKIAKKVLQYSEDVEFLIAGDGPYRRYIDALVSEYPDRVKYLGFLEHINILPHYAHIDILISTNRYSNATLPVVEALSAGIPVIAFNTQDTGKLIQDRYNGLLVSPFRVDQFAHKILELIKDENLLLTLSKNALKSSKSIPTWEERISMEIGKLEEIAGEVH